MCIQLNGDLATCDQEVRNDGAAMARNKTIQDGDSLTYVEHNKIRNEQRREKTNHSQATQVRTREPDLGESLVRVGIQGGHSGNTFKHGGRLLPRGSQRLAVPTPRGEELHQHHSVRVQDLHHAKNPRDHGPRTDKDKIRRRRA